MKKQVVQAVAALGLLMPIAVSLSALPLTAVAQPAPPQVESLAVESDDGIRPGARLSFRLEGTPRVQASVRVRGLREAIPLREVRPGIYVGRYTIKRTDSLSADTALRAHLRHGNRSSVAEYELGQAMGVQPPVAVVPPPVPRPVDPVRIERFGMLPIDRLEPGAELQFAVEGMPGAQVSVDLPGVERDVRLRETRPGHYEGSYTLRRSDDVRANRPAVATLRMGDRAVTATMSLLVGQGGNRPPGGGDQRPPNLVQLVPAEGATVPAGGPVSISAAFEDGRGSGVDPASVRILVSGRNLTSEAQVSPGAFNLRTMLPPGRHSVEVVARDQAGNAVRKSWSFEVAAAAPVNVPLRVLNFRNNDAVGSGTTVVQGRTLAHANVEVRVVAAPPVGLPINVSQELLARTVQADQNGLFSFSFAPQIVIPGARYEIHMVSIRSNLKDEERLTLLQR